MVRDAYCRDSWSKKEASLRVRHKSQTREAIQRSRKLDCISVPEYLPIKSWQTSLKAFNYFFFGEKLIIAVQKLNSENDHTEGQEMTAAKKSEVRGLLERSSFKFMLKQEVPTDANGPLGRFFDID